MYTSIGQIGVTCLIHASNCRRGRTTFWSSAIFCCKLDFGGELATMKAEIERLKADNHRLHSYTLSREHDLVVYEDIKQLRAHCTYKNHQD